MTSIGNIVVKRLNLHKLLTPISKPIVKGPTFPVLVSPEIVSSPVTIILPGGKGAAHFKEVVQGISQTVLVSPGSVARVKISGVVGFSYTQTSFTFESYTISGAPKSKGLIDNISITEPLAVRRVKRRSLFEDSPQLTELSHTLTIERRKARPLTQSTIIGESLTVLPQTNLLQTLTETNIISESLTTVKESKRLHAETVDESHDVSFELPGVKQVLTEIVDVGDAIVKEITYGAGHLARELFEDIIPTTDSITTEIRKTRAPTESIPISDNLVIETTTSAVENTLDETTEESHTVRMELTKNKSVPLQTTDIIDSVTGEWISPNFVVVRDEVVMKVGRGRRLTENVEIIG